jgi:hypothetical protein
MAINACDRVRLSRPDWSVTYQVLASRAPTAEEAARGAKRVIQKWRILEASPVSRGAGVGQCTLEASCHKSVDPELIAKGLRVVAEAKRILAATAEPRAAASEVDADDWKLAGLLLYERLRTTRGNRR